MKRFTNVQDLIDGPGLQQALQDARGVVEHPWNHEALGKHKTLGLLFMLIVIFLPGGLMQGVNRLIARVTGSRKARQAAKVHEPAPAAGKE